MPASLAGQVDLVTDSVTVSRTGMRRDAALNYTKVIDAAREVLGELGTDASMEQVAGRAGVGIGTVYRRFPSKDALIDELIRLAMEELLAAAEVAVLDDDGTGLEQFLWKVGQCFADRRRYAGHLLSRSGLEEGARLIRLRIAQLTENACAAGKMSPVVKLGDVMSLIWSLRELVAVTGAQAPDAWKRHLDIHLVALKSAALQELHPAMTEEQLAGLAGRG